MRHTRGDLCEKPRERLHFAWGGYHARDLVFAETGLIGWDSDTFVAGDGAAQFYSEETLENMFAVPERLALSQRAGFLRSERTPQQWFATACQRIPFALVRDGGELCVE